MLGRPGGEPRLLVAVVHMVTGWPVGQARYATGSEIPNLIEHGYLRE